MHSRSTQFIALFAVIVLITSLVLVTSISSLDSGSATGAHAAPLSQPATATSTDSDASVAGSTDGILAMGVVIALIVLLPMLLSRALWSRHT